MGHRVKSTATIESPAVSGNMPHEAIAELVREEDGKHLGWILPAKAMIFASKMQTVDGRVTPELVSIQKSGWKALEADTHRLFILLPVELKDASS